MYGMVRRLMCLFLGHNCSYSDLPAGWSEQPCKTCGQTVRVFKRS